ncbi:unnamed protein product [Porites evermanni]|uniref:Uncharacterized protein n=1 Tax=Porites evermanni TaxID=104178 RepID=A0ABN8MA72_9CNID|nr:unnamed protein product [Porites evermanni]
MRGGTGGLVEFKASLLASHGFAALALDYLNSDGLPRGVTNMDVYMEYYEEAANWLNSHPMVSPHGVGVHAKCFGSYIALLMASLQMKAIKAVVAISPLVHTYPSPFKYKGKVSEVSPFEHSKKIQTEEGSIWRYAFPTISNLDTPVSKYPYLTPVENISCPLLLVYGTNDLLLNVDFSVNLIRDRLKKRGREHLCSVLRYPGAGHLIEPPYTPHCYASYTRNMGEWSGDFSLVWGGEMKHGNSCKLTSSRYLLLKLSLYTIILIIFPFKTSFVFFFLLPRSQNKGFWVFENTKLSLGCWVRKMTRMSEQELEAVLVKGLSDVAEEGRETWVGKPTDKLLLVERNGRGITKENKTSPAEDEPRQYLRGTTVTKTTSTGKTFAHNQEKTLRYSNRKPSQPKFGQNKKKRYTTRTPRHANKASSTTQTQRRHMACATLVVNCKNCRQNQGSKKIQYSMTNIIVAGLKPLQKITLGANIVGDGGEIFQSHAHYIADKHGEVDVDRDSSLGGSYSGVEPMGLLWSMKQAPEQKKGLCLFKRDVTKPYNGVLSCFDGHVTPHQEQPELKPLSSTTFQRWYMADGVKRIPVREGRIRGTLFLPPGEGPFPGVLDLLGAAGGLVEFKAALLASHGFAALALAYIGYDDLPAFPPYHEMEYFEDGANWLSSHPKVLPHGIGIHAICYGAMIALMMANLQMKPVKAIAAISPLIHVYPTAFKYKGSFISEVAHYDQSKKVLVKDGSICRNVFPTATNPNIPESKYPYLAPVENLSCPLLLVYGTHDLNVDATFSVNLIRDRLRKQGKENLYSVLRYPGAGHLIEPPYTPHFYATYAKRAGAVSGDHHMVWGGETKCHAKAQEDAWPEIIRFLRNNISLQKPETGFEEV